MSCQAAVNLLSDTAQLNAAESRYCSALVSSTAASGCIPLQASQLPGSSIAIVFNLVASSSPALQDLTAGVSSLSASVPASLTAVATNYGSSCSVSLNGQFPPPPRPPSPFPPSLASLIPVTVSPPPPPPPAIVVPALEYDNSLTVTVSNSTNASASQKSAQAGSQLLQSVNVPPVITLIGNSSVVLSIYSTYADQGAYATDITGSIPVKLMTPIPLNLTNQVTTVPFIALYVATSPIGGLSANVTRSISVYDPCAPSAFTCPSTLSCSVNGQCGAVAAQISSLLSSSGTAYTSGSSSSLAASSSALFQATPQTTLPLIPDTTPPVITVNAGNYPGQQFVTDTGTLGWLTNVTVGTTYVDPGAVAYKIPPNNPNTTLNFTSSIVVSGVATISTTSPTSPSSPYVVSYDCQDNAVPPNIAVTVRRRVQVVCSGSNFICTNQDGSLSCSFNGACGVSVPASAQQGISSSSSSVTSLPGLLPAISSTAATTAIPTITLVGSSTVTISVGTPYSSCLPGLVTGCDQGVIATAVTSGDLNSQVYACQAQALANGVTAPLTYQSSGVIAAYCGINSAVPGTYSVIYTVSNGNGATATATRTVVVAASCPAGEVSCSDGSCAPSGSCGLTSTSSSSSTTTTAASSPTSLTSAVVQRLPPTLTLVTTSVVGISVNVPQGSSYQLCAPGVVPTASALCDPGVTASDVVDGDLLSKVLLCPPANCGSTGCSGNGLLEKSLSSCGIDTSNSSTIGSVFYLNFLVYNSAGLNASVYRSITVSSPCPAGQNLCSDGHCYTVACSLATSVRSSASSSSIQDYLIGATPLLVLLPTSTTQYTSLALTGGAPSNQTVYLPLGEPSSFSLLPCSSGLGLPVQVTCAAAGVWVLQNGSIVDQTFAVNVQALSSSTTASCSLAGMMAGTCLPGLYYMQYSLPSSNLLAYLNVYVETLTSLSLNYSFVSNTGTDPVATEAFIQSLYGKQGQNVLTTLAQDQLPQFGADPTMLRSVSFEGAYMTSTGNPSSKNSSNSTLVYIIHIAYTALLGSSAPANVPSSLEARRRLAALQGKNITSRQMVVDATRNLVHPVGLEASTLGFDNWQDPYVDTVSSSWSGETYDDEDFLNVVEEGWPYRTALYQQSLLNISSLIDFDFSRVPLFSPLGLGGSDHDATDLGEDPPARRGGPPKPSSHRAVESLTSALSSVKQLIRTDVLHGSLTTLADCLEILSSSIRTSQLSQDDGIMRSDMSAFDMFDRQFVGMERRLLVRSHRGEQHPPAGL
ncbi:hypothetical protein CEUSTIGMA_g5148.t1 [Chlamydomonas eustigma]|uniref:Uncharacterized protein n=1 Tax=Chlamydomonas eustigma TaxID=1157962 RepID=A0A250X3Q4_9CHLO|nr:hypothetical protein CEUSTIGMA_g5148.t1 [Chlamydomonas eustigma]|eukprot:GAX77705.1 hypothetical protein CEUSTIGMA_g5148.t1 [Chlamydomonas eustigma]